MSIFAGKTLMITGGTGSFGNAVLNRFLRTDIAEIRIFSRDEKKQDDMRHEYQAKYPDVAHKIKFYIGDVRSLESCRAAMPGTDYIFHAAALKQVPSCEFFLLEAAIAFNTSSTTVQNVRTSYGEKGLNATLNRKKRDTPPVEAKVTGEVEAHIIALACAEPPKGYAKWTLRLLADRSVKLGYIDSISHTQVGRILKKTNISLT